MSHAEGAAAAPFIHDYLRFRIERLGKVIQLRRRAVRDLQALDRLG